MQEQSTLGGTCHRHGALTIQRVVMLKQELFEALDELDRILLNLSDGTAVDPACLQRLCAGQRTAILLKRELALAGSTPLAASANEAGFVRHVGCALDCKQNCLWETGENRPGQPG